MIDVLSESLDLADGIQHNTALDNIARPKLESQLADGLALFADVRTRTPARPGSMGLAAIAIPLARIRRLKLSGDLQDKLAPHSSGSSRTPTKGRASVRLDRNLSSALFAI